MGDLKAVLSALQGAKGPDREVDGLIAIASGKFFTEGSKYGDEPDYCYIDPETGGKVMPGHGGMQMVPKYTASVDAALALVAEKLPGHTYLIGRGKTRPEEPLHGVFFSPDGSMKAGSEGSDWFVEVEHESLPICILTALLSALSAQSEGPQ